MPENPTELPQSAARAKQNPPPAAKPGYQTSEFYFVLLVFLANVAASFAHVLDPKWAAVLGTVSAQIYLFVRIAHKTSLNHLAVALLPNEGALEREA